MATIKYPIAPSDLARELKVDAKAIRRYLRANHTRPKTAHGTDWAIDAKLAKAVRAKYGKATKPKAKPKAKPAAPKA